MKKLRNSLNSRAQVVKKSGKNEQQLPQAIDHFHKWQPLLHSFVFMLVRPTALILKQKFFRNLLVISRLERLISNLKQKNILFGRHYERGLLIIISDFRASFN